MKFRYLCYMNQNKCFDDGTEAAAAAILDPTRPALCAEPHASGTVQLIQKVIYYCQKQVDTSPEEALLWAQCKSMAQASQESCKKEVISVLKAGVALGEASAQFKVVSKKKWARVYQEQVDELIKENARLSNQLIKMECGVTNNKP